MLTYDEAITRILAQAPTLHSERFSILESLGLILAEDIVAPHPIPPFTNSAMDGFAVRYEDVAPASPANHVRLEITQEIAAGSTSQSPVVSGSAARIMTGAPLPEGADTIVPVEDTETVNGEVMIKDPGAPGQFVRRAGEDVEAGAKVVSNGTAIRAAEIGMFAAVGRADVRAIRRPRVAIISTGDELVAPGSPLLPGQIYNSNGYSLAAQVIEAGGIVAQRLHVRDNPEMLRAAFDASADCDLLLTSGGVSVGEYDHVKPVFAERGAIDFWRVAIRPGKPLAFGTWDDKLFFGLPGNPVSSMVTFELFVRPTLRKMLGFSNVFRTRIQATLTETISHEPGRRSFQRVIVTHEADQYFARSTGKQGSGMMSSTVSANALLIIPENTTQISAGEMAAVLLLDTGQSMP